MIESAGAVTLDVGSVNGGGSAEEILYVRCAHLRAVGDALVLRFHDLVAARNLYVSVQRMMGAVEDVSDVSRFWLRAQYVGADGDYSGRNYLFSIQSGFAIWWCELDQLYVNGAGVMEWACSGRGFFKGMEWYTAYSNGSPMLRLAGSSIRLDVMQVRGSQDAETIRWDGGGALVQNGVITGALPLLLNADGGNLVVRNCALRGSGPYGVMTDGNAYELRVMGSVANSEVDPNVTLLGSLAVDEGFFFSSGE